MEIIHLLRRPIHNHRTIVCMAQFQQVCCIQQYGESTMVMAQEPLLKSHYEGVVADEGRGRGRGEGGAGSGPNLTCPTSCRPCQMYDD